MVKKITRISFIGLFGAFIILIGGIFVIQATSSPYQLNYQSASQSVEQDACCGHTDTTEPVIRLITPGNNSVLLADYVIAFEITDDNPMDDLLPTEVLFNWDGSSNITLNAPYNISMTGTDGEHVLNIFATDAKENWAGAKFIFTTTSDPDAVVIIGVDYTKTTIPRRSDGFLFLTTFSVLILGVMFLTKRKL